MIINQVNRRFGGSGGLFVAEAESRINDVNLQIASSSSHIIISFHIMLF